MAQTLEAMADRLEGKTKEGIKHDLDESLKKLEQVAELCRLREPGEPFSVKMQTFLPLSRRIESLAVSLDREI